MVERGHSSNNIGQETDREPMRSQMVRAREAEGRPCLLSISLMTGFPYADVPWMGPAVIAPRRRLSSTNWPGGCGRLAANSSSPAPARRRRCD
jgi:hypothetical protein